MSALHGYLLVHFVEDPGGHAEKIYFSLSRGDDPLRWRRANGGRPVLASHLGTTGVRDPYLVRGAGECFLIATDLRVWGGDGRGWDAWTRTGSRSIVVWRSTDLVTWSEPWLAEVAPPHAGMAWAPEAGYDAATGEFTVYWSSHLYGPDDPGHRADSYSRILAARTRDFRTFTEATTLVDDGPGRGVIDLTVARDEGRTVLFLKGNDTVKLHQRVGSDLFAGDFTTVATRIADDRHADVEGPLVFRDHRDGRWYLWVDQFSDPPGGYVALRSTSLASGRWEAVPPDEFELPPATKHGVVVPLLGDEWTRLDSAYPA